MKMGKINHEMINQALAWVACLRSETVGEADLADFADWLNASENHQQAWDSAMDTWETLGAVSYLPVEQLLAADTERKPNNSWLDNLFSGFWKPLTSLSALALVAVGLFLIVQEDRQIYYSAVGEYQQITLQDGSILELNTDTSVAVLLGENSRDLELLQGEAFFTVASDKSRPFIVSLGDARVQALGTAFNIYRQSDEQSMVSVVEGVVRVSEASGSSTAAPESKMLLANDVVLVNKSSGLSELQASNIEQATAWRSGQILFDRASLDEAVAILNRYLERKLVVTGGATTGHRISGVFSIHEQAETLSAVAQAFDLALVAEADNWLLSQSNP